MLKNWRALAFALIAHSPLSAGAQQAFEIDTSIFSPQPAQESIVTPPAPAPAEDAPAAPVPEPANIPPAPEAPAAVYPAIPSNVSQPLSGRVNLSPSSVNPHTFDVDVQTAAPIDLISVTVKEGDTIVGRHSLLPDSMQTAISYQTAAFRFLPARHTVEVEVDCGGAMIRRQFGPFKNEIQKMVIVDRDAFPQRVLLIEGDRWLLFGRIVDSAPVSTGLNEYGGTPLGYYHIRNKEYYAVNAFREWDMPFAHWYTPSNYPEGVNGLHQGFPGTIYGIRQSHGCTRMPEDFAKRIWEWSAADIPVIYIGNEAQTKYDMGRFNLSDYPFFKALIDQMIAYRQGLQAGQESPTYFTAAQSEIVNQLRPYEDDLLDACARFRRYSQGQTFNKLVQGLVASSRSS